MEKFPYGFGFDIFSAFLKKTQKRIDFMLAFAEIFLTMNAERRTQNAEHRTQNAERRTLQLSDVHTPPARMLESVRREVRVGNPVLHPKILMSVHAEPLKTKYEHKIFET